MENTTQKILSYVITILLTIFTSNVSYAQYCASNGNSTADEYIGRVQLNTIDNSTAAGVTSTGYSDYTGISTTLDTSTGYTITITPTWTGVAYSEGYSVWIDYNQDGDFNDVGEQVFTSAASASTPVSGAFTVLASATAGNTVMRVSMKYNAIPTSCESFGYGEVEDYSININAVSACGSPVNTFPYTEDFESGTGGWAQGTGDDIDWTRYSGGTPSGTTGPSGAGSGAWYMYIESSSPNYPTKTANFESPCFDISGIGSPIFTFSYHMFGSNMGTLNVDISTDSGVTYPTNLWTQTSQVQSTSGSAWNTINLDLSAYIGQTVRLRFNGITDDGYRGDMAIDNISLTVSSSGPEINIQGNATTIADGDTTPATIDDTDFGSLGAGSTLDYTFSIQNLGTTTLNLTGGTPIVDISGDAAFTILTQPSAASIASGGADLTFVARFAPTVNGTVQAIISIDSNDGNENPYNFTIQGTGVASLTEGPGGVTADLELWLKGTDGLSYTDGQSVSLWIDQGRGANATVNTIGQEPTYRDNATKNVNFNPVVEFDNTYTTFTTDGDFSFDDTTTEFLEGASGMYTQDIFVVLTPDDAPINNSFGSMDIFCGDWKPATNERDATGVGGGSYTARFSGEIFTFALGPNGPNAYGVAEIGTGSSYDNAGILNARNNTGVTQQELYYNANNIETNQTGLSTYINVNDSRYWIGRSEGWEATLNARVAEIITYSARKDDSNLTTERNKIQSYLAVKYGITLGVNGTSQDYVDSNGDIIWDQSVNSGYNYDIAGIGRDDDSDLIQKQSSSVNNGFDGTGPTEGILSIGLTDLYDTNNENIINNTANTFEDKEFLMWGNNGVDLNLAASVVSVNMSAGITPSLNTDVTFTGMQRIWKVTEVVGAGGDIPMAKVSIPQSAVRNISPPGDFLMFISDSPIFDPTADYRIMSANGSNLEVEYDFNGVKYITFGYAPQVEVKRSIYFDGATDYVNMDDVLNLNTTNFTISAWVKRGASSSNTSILSKRNAAYTEGYDFKINASNRFEMSWKNGTTQTITSNIVIPQDEWHQVAIIYSGATANLYIDGVLDQTASLSAPVSTTQFFNIGAADKSTSFYEGNIDEVRVWNTALSVNQLHYIMNQEIEDATNFVDGSILPQTITNNEVSFIPWTDLAGYYPMSIYTYTNTNDESGNGNFGSLQNLDTVDRQTAPLPYESQANGTWTTDATWLNNTVQTLPNTLSIVDGITPIDWNIVETNHDVTIDTNGGLGRERSVLGLIVNSNELQVNGNTASGTGNGLTVTHYLKLDGELDLEGESQLIQSEDSDLDVTSAGTLERDQQGTADLFTYNYWAAPVGISNTTTNNNNYTLPDVLYDGTTPIATPSAPPKSISFLTSGYNGTSGDPIGIADYWIWKFSNQLSDDYASWQHVRSTGSLNAGEGYTMKGTTDTGGAISTEQNYVYNGKPHNGDVTLTLSAGNDYLIGNPYASAIDANEFILDNVSAGAGRAASNIINGTLYFWEHFASSTHVLAEYQGGYGTYTLMGGITAISNDVRINATGVSGTKTPQQYIPVGQGFFVTAGTGGSVSFKNSQRIFKTEASDPSVFMRANNNVKTTKTARISQSNSDVRQKIRLQFDSPKGYYRQLLAGVDKSASDQFDVGYDALLIEDNKEDLFWVFDNEKYVIQAVDNFNFNQNLPLGVKIDQEGLATIKIETLENIASNTDIYLHDIDLDVYHDLKASDYEVFLTVGEHLNRFEIVFNNNEALGDSDNEFTNLDVHFSNAIKSIIIVNPTLKQINAVVITNVLGQFVYQLDNIMNTNYSEFKVENLSAGTYIIEIKTDKNTLTKKVIVE